MATLVDTIRLQTDVNLQGFVDLSRQLSQIQLSLTSVAASARSLSTTLGQNTTSANTNATSLANLTAQTNNATRANNGLFSSFTSLISVRSQLVGLFGAFSVGAFAKQMVEAQSKVESFGLSMNNLLGAGYGAKLVEDLKKFTVETPLNFEQVIKSASQLVGSFKAAGASSKTIATEIPQILDSLGNSAAALGGETRLGRLVYAFSQVQATGRLMGTEVRQITETGFPLLAVLTDSLNERFPKLSLSVADVQKRVSEGKVSFEDFKIAILSAGKEGGVFAGSMDIMANTVQGRIDKLKESMFFAFANIGDQFNNTAKEVINFGSNVVQALFGTESATRRTIEILKTVISTWIAYTAATKLAAAQTVIGTVIDRISLIVRGQMILANASLTGSYNVLTLAETEATVAARAFNTTAMSNPLGLLVLGIGAVVGAYQLYNSSVEQAEENQKKLSNEIASSVAPIKTQQAEFDNLAKAVLSTSLPLSEQEKILNKLKLQYPILLKGVTDLSTAEEILNNNKHKTNSTLDFRNAKLEELKKKYPQQLKGIDTLAEAELKLGGVVRATDRDFAILSATMENNIRIQNQIAGANDNFAKKIKAQGDLAKLRSGQTGANLIDFGANVIDNTPALIAEKEKEIASYDKAANSFVKAAEVIRAKNEELTSKLKYDWKEIPKTIEKTGEEGKEKALKYQAETIMQGKILDEIAFRKELETSRENENTIRTLQKTYDDSRLKDAIGTQKQKLEAQNKLDHDFNNDMADLKRKWNAKEKAEAIKAEKEKNNQIESEAKKSAERMWDIIVERIEDEQKEKEKAAQEDKKFQEEVVKETIKIKDSEQKLKDKILIFEKISKAKNSKDILKIEEQLSLDILKEAQDRINKEMSFIKAKLDYLKSNGKEQTDEYRDLYKRFLELQGDYNDSASKLLDVETEAVNKSIKKKEDAFKGLVDATQSIVNSIFDQMDSDISDAMSKTDNSLDKFFLDRKKKDLKEVKDFVSIAGKAVSGDIAGAVSGAVIFVYDLVKNTMNKQADWEKAILERQTQLYKEYAKTAKASIAALLTDISSVTNVYENIIPKSFINVKDGSNQYLTVLQYQYKVLQSQSKELDTISEKLGTRGNAVDGFIKKEVAYAESIKSLYQDIIKDEKDRHEKAIDFLNKEFETSNKQEIDLFNSKKTNIDKLYNDKIKSINDTYNEDVRLINAKFDLESTRANQKYDKETLAILQAGSKQLEATITNEISLNSVRTEFAGKRQFILDSYALANKTITADMSEEEIAGINAAIKARDAALAKLQKWYNDELTLISTSEGQKRKEYSATELIANGVAYRLEQAAIAFDAAEIARNADKNVKLAAAAKIKSDGEKAAKAESDKSIEDLETLHKATMTAIDNTYQLAIRKEQDLTKANLIKINGDMERDLTASYNRLINALSGEISRYASLLTSINDKTTEEYKALQTELQILIDKYKELTGVLPTITTTEIPAIVRQPRGFEKGTDDTSVALKGQRVVDNKGGWQAILHPQEAVFSKADMTQMETVFGKRPTRQEVIENFKIGVVNQVTPQMNPFVIQKMQANGIGNFDKLGDKIERLAKEVSKKMSPVVYVDKGGIRTFYKNLNSQIEVKNQRFK